jgi:ATP-dependent DNA helicase DinG
MTDLQRAVAEALNAQGALAKAHPGFTPREGQDHMAQAIARTLKSGGQLVVEAGTGVGKTYAYLVPVLLSGQRAMISTATKALQDQLALRDIPRLQQALGVQARVSVLKGRSSYLCLYRLATARQHPLAETQGNQFELSRIERWATATLSGDLAEMPDLADQSPIEPLVTSTRDNCLGGTCPQAGACFVNRARATAMASDIVVVNHHLFFADMNVRESGVAELLPNTDVVVFDEAHQLNDIGVQFLGRQLSTRQLEDLTHDLCLQSSLLALGSAQWSAWVAGVSQMTATLRAWGGSMGSQSTVPWDGAVPSGFPESDWHAVTECLRSDLSQLSQLLEHLAESSPDLNQLAVRVDRCLQELTFFTAPVMEDQIRWLECGPHLKMQCSPLSISMGLQSHMDPGENLEAAKKTWVFTSATLGTDPELAMFRNACGLQTAQVLRVDSPFDYASQAALYIPENFPLPADPLHSIEVAHLVAHAARILGGAYAGADNQPAGDAHDR